MRSGSLIAHGQHWWRTELVQQGRNQEEGSAMIDLGACPRRRGPVVDFAEPFDDSPLCVVCGWRRSEIPAEVSAFLGKDISLTRHIRKRIGAGKPPLSG